jgi:hypothetical protein
MRITRAQFDEYLNGNGACKPALAWMVMMPEKSPEELWNLCTEPHWMWWLVEHLEGCPFCEHGTSVASYPLSVAISDIYNSSRFRRTFIFPTNFAACAYIRSAIPYSKIEDLLVTAFAPKEWAMNTMDHPMPANIDKRIWGVRNLRYPGWLTETKLGWTKETSEDWRLTWAEANALTDHHNGHAIGTPCHVRLITQVGLQQHHILHTLVPLAHAVWPTATALPEGDRLYVITEAIGEDVKDLHVSPQVRKIATLLPVEYWAPPGTD